MYVLAKNQVNPTTKGWRRNMVKKNIRRRTSSTNFHIDVKERFALLPAWQRLLNFITKLATFGSNVIFPVWNRSEWCLPKSCNNIFCKLPVSKSECWSKSMNESNEESPNFPHPLKVPHQDLECWCFYTLRDNWRLAWLATTWRLAEGTWQIEEDLIWRTSFSREHTTEFSVVIGFE